MLNSNSKKYRIGILGAGKIVEDNHLPVLCSNDRSTVAWVSDISRKRVNLLSRMYNVKGNVCDNISSEMARDIDVILIAIPLGSRKLYFESCARHSLYVMCEKPFATSQKFQQELCTLLDYKHLAVVYQYRYYRTLNAIRDILNSRKYGKLKRVVIRCGMYNLKCGSPDNFRSDSTLAGGGILVELGIHALDFVLSLLPPCHLTLSKCSGIYRNGIDYEISLHATVVSNLDIDLDIKMSQLRPVRSGITFEFNECNLYVSEQPNSHLSLTFSNSKKAKLSLDGVEGAINSREAFAALWNDFFSALDNDKILPTAPHLSYFSAILIEDVYNTLKSRV